MLWKEIYHYREMRDAFAGHACYTRSGWFRKFQRHTTYTSQVKSSRVKDVYCNKTNIIYTMIWDWNPFEFIGLVKYQQYSYRTWSHFIDNKVNAGASAEAERSPNGTAQPPQAALRSFHAEHFQYRSVVRKHHFNTRCIYRNHICDLQVTYNDVSHKWSITYMFKRNSYRIFDMFNHAWL